MLPLSLAVRRQTVRQSETSSVRQSNNRHSPRPSLALEIAAAEADRPPQKLKPETPDGGGIMLTCTIFHRNFDLNYSYEGRVNTIRQAQFFSRPPERRY
jgi:hypothetical protein